MEETIQSIRMALSVARMSSYEKAFKPGYEIDAPLNLYAWNAEVSAAFLAPLHICEVVVRNAIADAIEAQYGERWPWSAGFERSLPDPANGYSQRKDLCNARRNQLTTGKVIPELKFAFWQKLLSQRHDMRLWNRYLTTIFPNIDSSLAVAQQRQALFEQLEKVRKLRNRIAHHEPIFTRDLRADYLTIRRLIDLRCRFTAEWMEEYQHVLRLMECSPIDFSSASRLITLKQAVRAGEESGESYLTLQEIAAKKKRMGTV